MSSSWAQQRRHSYKRRLTDGCEHSFRRLNQIGRQLFRSLFLPTAAAASDSHLCSARRRRSLSASCCTWGQHNRQPPEAAGSERAAGEPPHGAASKQEENAAATLGAATTNRHDKMSKLIGLLDAQPSIGSPEPEVGRESQPLPRLESSWREFVRLDEPHNDDQLQQQAAHQEAIWELLTTELAYLSRLRLIMDLFQSTLLALQRHNLLTEVNGRRLFSNVRQVYAANREMWARQLGPMLERARHFRTPLDATLLRDAFVQTGATFAPYHSYCLEQARSLAYLRHQNRTNELFKVYLAWCESKKECDRLRLADLLAKPTQRLTKYSLLLGAILKRCQLPQPRTCLQLMVAHVNRFVLGVDLELRRQEERASLAACIRRLESHFEVGPSEMLGQQAAQLMRPHCRLNWLADPLFGCPKQCQRRLIFDSTSGLYSSHTHIRFKDLLAGSSKLPVSVLLFTDCLLVCRPPGSAPLSSSNKSQPFKKPASNQQQQQQHPSGSLRSSQQPPKSSTHLTQQGPLSEPLSTAKTRSVVLARLSNLGRGGRLISSSLTQVPLASNGDQQHFSFNSQHATTNTCNVQTNVEAPNEPRTRTAAAAAGVHQCDGLICIRPPYKLHTLLLHKLSDGQLLFLQLDSSTSTLTSSFVLHFTSLATRSRNTLEVADCLASPLNVSPVHQPAGPTTSGDQPLLLQEQHFQDTATAQSFSMADRLVALIKEAQAELQLVANFHHQPLNSSSSSSTDNSLFLDQSQWTQIAKLSSLATQEASAPHTSLLSVEGPHEWRIEAGECDSRALIEQHQMLLLNHGLLTGADSLEQLAQPAGSSSPAAGSSQQPQPQLPARLLSPNRCQLLRRCHLNRSARVGADTGSGGAATLAQACSTECSSSSQHQQQQLAAAGSGQQRASVALLRRQNVVQMSLGSGEQSATTNFRSDSTSTSGACASSSVGSSLGWQPSSAVEHRLLTATSSTRGTHNGASILCISQATTIEDSTSYAEEELPSSGGAELSRLSVSPMARCGVLDTTCRSHSMDSRHGRLVAASSTSGWSQQKEAGRTSRLRLPGHTPARSLSSSWMSVSTEASGEPATTSTCCGEPGSATTTTTLEQTVERAREEDTSTGSLLLQVPLLTNRRVACSASSNVASAGYLGFHDKIRLHKQASARRRRRLLRTRARRRAQRLGKLVHFLLRAASKRARSLRLASGSSAAAPKHCRDQQHASRRTQG